jgi:uncharacterized protein YecE (DUF72 family)
MTTGSRFHVGTSGFSYDEWRPGVLSLDDLKKDAMLPFYAERLPAVELNNTFYRMPNGQDGRRSGSRRCPRRSASR